VTLHDLSALGFNLAQGLPSDAMSALIAVDARGPANCSCWGLRGRGAKDDGGQPGR
jgi:hypothetical protein